MYINGTTYTANKYEAKLVILLPKFKKTNPKTLQWFLG